MLIKLLDDETFKAFTKDNSREITVFFNEMDAWSRGTQFPPKQEQEQKEQKVTKQI